MSLMSSCTPENITAMVAIGIIVLLAVAVCVVAWRQLRANQRRYEAALAEHEEHRQAVQERLAESRRRMVQ